MSDKQTSGHEPTWTSQVGSCSWYLTPGVYYV